MFLLLQIAEICMVSQQLETKTTTVFVEVHHSEDDSISNTQVYIVYNVKFRYKDRLKAQLNIFIIFLSFPAMVSGVFIRYNKTVDVFPNKFVFITFLLKILL